jgi:cysteine-rich repeat protein
VCNIVAGDGYRAGNEECDDGNLLSDDGCSNLMKIEAGATCAVDLSGKSICKKCGNGRLETNEVCDDAHYSMACMNCTSVKAGWSCSDTSCVAGPASVREPVPTTAQEDSLEVSWIAPDANGLPLSQYILEWITSSSAWSSSLSAVVPPTRTSYVIGNLTSSTFYVVRVRACNAEGCSAFSAASAPFSTLKKIVQLTEIGTMISTAVVSAANSSGVSVNGSIGVALPPPPPLAPLKQEVNETLIQLNQALFLSSALQSQVAVVPMPSQFSMGFSRDVTDLTVSELIGRLEFTLQLVRNSDGSTQHEGLDSKVSVRWQFVGFDALVNITELNDVSPMSGVVIFQPGEVNKTIAINVVNNTFLNYGRSDKQFVLQLAAPLGGSLSKVKSVLHMIMFLL